MSRLVRGQLALTIGSMLLGCGGRARPPVTPTPAVVAAPAAPPPGSALAVVTAFEEAVCACTTAACVAPHSAELDAWTEANRDALMSTLRDKLGAARLEAHVDRGEACIHALAAGAGDEAADGVDRAAPRPPAADATAALAGVTQLVDELCACADQPCGAAVFERLAAIEAPTGKLTSTQEDEVHALGTRLQECQARLVAPAASPPAADDDPAGLVRPPVAGDLKGYLKRVKGKGKLTATIETNLGTLHCTLFEKQTPMTVANFVGLATGQKPWRDVDGSLREGTTYYDGLRFHRVIPGFMIQGGDPADTGTGGPGYRFANEIVPELRHVGPGVLSMANAGPDTNGSQFFITDGDAPWLDGKHTVFGACAEVDVVKRITSLDRDAQDRPSRPVTIKRLTISRR